MVQRPICLATPNLLNLHIAIAKVAPAQPKHLPPAAPKKMKLTKGQKKALAAERAAEFPRSLGNVTEYPRSYLKDEDLRASMQSTFQSVENAIHPDRLSVVTHKARRNEIELEPREIREADMRRDEMMIKTEPGMEDEGMLGFTSTQDTLDGNDTSYRRSSVFEPTGRFSPYWQNVVEGGCMKVEEAL